MFELDRSYKDMDEVNSDITWLNSGQRGKYYSISYAATMWDRMVNPLSILSILSISRCFFIHAFLGGSTNPYLPAVSRPCPIWWLPWSINGPPTPAWRHNRYIYELLPIEWTFRHFSRKETPKAWGDSRRVPISSSFAFWADMFSSEALIHDLHIPRCTFLILKSIGKCTQPRRRHDIPHCILPSLSVCFTFVPWENTTPSVLAANQS